MTSAERDAINNIATLTVHQGDREAAAQIAQGNRQAETIQALGQIPSQALAQYQQLKGLQQKQELQNIEIQQHKQALADAKQLDDAYKQAQELGPDGQLRVNEEKFFGAIPGSKQGTVRKQWAETQKAYEDYKQTTLENHGKQLNLIGSMAAGVKANGNQPQDYLEGIAFLKQTGVIPAAVADQYAAQVSQDPSQVGALVDRHLAESDKQRELLALSQHAQSSLLSAQATATKDAAETTAAAAKVTDQRTANALKQLAQAAPLGLSTYQRRFDGFDPTTQATLKAQGFSPEGITAGEFDGPATADRALQAALTPEQIVQQRNQTADNTRQDTAARELKAYRQAEIDNQKAVLAETTRYHNLEAGEKTGDAHYKQDFDEYKEFLSVNATKQREERERAPKKFNTQTLSDELQIGAYRQPPDFKSWRDSQGKLYPGKRVTFKNGKTETITTVHPDGTFESQ